MKQKPSRRKLHSTRIKGQKLHIEGDIENKNALYEFE
jgi:hypothetical protein